MRYFTEKPRFVTNMYGEVYHCDHPLYDTCTLFRQHEKGLAVIQQRFDEETKATRWGEIDGWLADTLYLHQGFKTYLRKRADVPVNSLYPTVTVRQMMWALRMKPLPRMRWETVFDRREV